MAHSYRSFTSWSHLRGGTSLWRILAVSLTFWSLDGCSLQDFGYLSSSSGGAEHSGGANSQQGSGGTESGSTFGGNGIGGAGTGGNAAGGAETDCRLGLTNCSASSGCVDLSTGKIQGSTIEHCGTCGLTCSLTNAESATCAAATCTPTCNMGFADCNGPTTNDGCETDVATNADKCGACGYACSADGVQARVCSAGICKPTCLPRYADCNPETVAGEDDGCEVYLDALAHCATTCTNAIACSATQVCNAGICEAPQGVVAISVPLTDVGQIQRFALKYPTLPNLANSSVTVRLYSSGTPNAQVNLYMSDAAFAGIGGTVFILNTLAPGWNDVVVPVGGASETYNPSSISQLNIEISSSGTGPWSEPAVVYIDRIWAPNRLVEDTFDASIGNIVPSTRLVVMGSTVTWLNSTP